MPAGQSHSEPGSFVHQGFVYMVGGNTLGDRVYRYDPGADTWQIVLRLPEKLLAPISRVVDGRLLVVSSGGGHELVPITRLYELEFPAKAIDPVIPTLSEQLAPRDRVILAGEVGHYDQATEDNSLYDWQLQPFSGASNGDALIGLETNRTVQDVSEGYAQFGYLLYFDKPGEYALWFRGLEHIQHQHTEQ